MHKRNIEMNYRNLLLFCYKKENKENFPKGWLLNSMLKVDCCIKMRMRQ